MNGDEALGLIRVEKEIVERRIDFPKQNEFLMLNAVSKDNTNEKFIIDINRKRAILSKCTFQKRVNTSIPLIRLDIDNKPHRNPDNELVQGTHIHIYKEGYNLSWAYPLHSNFLNEINPLFNLMKFGSTSSHNNTFVSFCEFCNITRIPIFQVVEMI